MKRLCKREALGAILITHHNIYYMIHFMRSMRESIIEGRFEEFVKEFFNKQFPDKKYPSWCIDALNVAGIDLKTD